jgi:hypothetical protein
MDCWSVYLIWNPLCISQRELTGIPVQVQFLDSDSSLSSPERFVCLNFNVDTGYSNVIKEMVFHVPELLPDDRPFSPESQHIQNPGSAFDI